MRCNLLLFLDADKDEKCFSTSQTSKSVVIHHDITWYNIQHPKLKLSAFIPFHCVKYIRIRVFSDSDKVRENPYHILVYFTVCSTTITWASDKKAFLCVWLLRNLALSSSFPVTILPRKKLWNNCLLLIRFHVFRQYLAILTGFYNSNYILKFHDFTKNLNRRVWQGSLQISKMKSFATINSLRVRAVNNLYICKLSMLNVCGKRYTSSTLQETLTAVFFGKCSKERVE